MGSNSLDDYDLTTRVRNSLSNIGIRTITDLTKMSERGLMRIPNFGRKSLLEVKELLAQDDLKRLSDDEAFSDEVLHRSIWRL